MKVKKVILIYISIIFVFGIAFYNFSFAEDGIIGDNCPCENYDGSKNEIVQSDKTVSKPLNTFQDVSLTTQSSYDVYNKLISLKDRFPDFTYWNHYVSNYNEMTDVMGYWDERFADTITSSPCSSHNSSYTLGGYDCNAFDGGIQCWGFASKLFYEVFGVRTSQIGAIYGTDISVGDWIRCNNDGHSGIVLSVSGDSFTMAEANVDYHCKIRWGSISYSKSSITYYKHSPNYNDIHFSTDSESPVISNVWYELITEGEESPRLDVHADGWDNVGIDHYDIYMWSDINGQDDMYSELGVPVSNGHVDRRMYFLSATTGTWYVHLYAFDSAGNVSECKGFGFTGPWGTEMSSGYERTIPDGDYMIAGAGDPNYYLDINGADYPATDLTNVMIWGSGGNIPESYDIWTVKYNGDGFYTISQKGTNMCLDVCGATVMVNGNIQVCASNGTSAQKWAISQNGRNGYRLQAKCSGHSLDIYGGTLSTGTNVQQYFPNDSNAQSWVFIPYQPQQTLPNGRYILKTAVNSNYELNVPNDVTNGTKVNIWSDDANSQNNAFDVTALSNGYYQIKHVASGKVLDVSGSSKAYGTDIILQDAHGGSNQEWAIMQNGVDGGYTLRSRCSGMALDLESGITENGNKIQQFPYHGGGNQTWEFIHAEYKIHYNVKEGQNVPKDQIKYYKSNIQLSNTKPTKDGYVFYCWNDSANLKGKNYKPGDIYQKDKNLTLYPVWKDEKDAVTITFNAGKGSCTTKKMQTFAGETYGNLPKAKRDGYVFMGWFTANNGGKEIKAENIVGNSNITLYAHYSKIHTSDWVLATAVPEGNKVVDEKWTYTHTLTEKTTSTQSSLSGWTKVGTDWEQAGTGTHFYADFPGGYDTSDALYSQYSGGSISSYENASNKRIVGNTYIKSYIYWHWTCNMYELAGGNYNVFIEDAYRWAGGREYYNFRAFETTDDYGHYDPNGAYGGECYYAWRGIVEDGSWWWFRLNVYAQPYTDYKKVNCFEKYTVTQEESDQKVQNGGEISHVKHLVKYEYITGDDQGITYGDVNQDKVVDIKDARLAKRIAMKDVTAKYTTIGFNAGDLDGNGKITVNEARKIKRAVLKETTL